MARRREARRFGRGPYLLGLRRDDTCWGTGFPFDVPAVAAAEALRLDAAVTLLAGDNGSGKSTLSRRSPRRWASPTRAGAQRSASCPPSRGR